MVERVVFYRVRKVKGRYYLVKEWYDPETGKKRSKCLGPCEAIERIHALLKDLSDEEIRKLIEIVKNGMPVVRGVGFEPTQAYAIGSSARPL